MPTEALKCPSCRANDPSPADAAGVHRCIYCGVRYRLTRGTPQTLATAANPAGTNTALLGVSVAALVILGVTVAVLVRSGPGATTTAPAPLPTTPAPASVPATPTIAVGLSEPAPAVAATTVPAPVVALAAEPDAPASARFELTHRRPASGASFYATGYVTNDSPFVIDRPKITAVLADAAGVEVGTAFGFAADVLGPGSREPAEILVMNPPPFETLTFEIAARRASYIPPRAEGLRLEANPVGPSTFGFASRGKVFNDGATTARFIHVYAFAFDEAGTLIGIDDTFADDQALAPGSASRFDLRMLDFGAVPVRWEFTVSAQTL